jgi:ferric-chelate reductase
VVYCNLHIKLTGKPQATTATAVYNEESDLIKLEVIPGSRFLTPKPNQHYFLYQYRSWKGWENHPFTLATWTSSNTPTPVNIEITLADNITAESKSNVINSMDPTSLVQSSSSDNSFNKMNPTTSKKKLIFLIRPSNGWTKRVREACLKQLNLPLPIPLLIEGPYGHSVPLNRYENVLFITGGTGIA